MSRLTAFFSRYFTPIALALALAMAVGVLKAKSDAAAMRRRVAELEFQVAQKRDAARSLKAEVQYLESPDRIEALSRKELAMAPAAPEDHRSLSLSPGP